MNSGLLQALAARAGRGGPSPAGFAEFLRMMEQDQSESVPALSHEEVQEKIASSGPSGFTVEEFKALLGSRRPRTVLLLLDAGFRVDRRAMKALIKSSMTELLLPRVLKRAECKYLELSPKFVKCGARGAIMQMIAAGLIVTPASLLMMAKCCFWGCVEEVLARTPALAFALHEDEPVWFTIGYEITAKFVPKTELHQCTSPFGFTYLMERLNTKHKDIDDLPLSSDPAEGFNPNHVAKTKRGVLTPLAVAIASSDPHAQNKLVRQLLAAGAVAPPEPKGGAMLSFMGSSNPATMRALVEAGASFDTRSEKGNLPLVDLIGRGEGADYNRRIEIAEGMVEFMDAAKFTRGDLEKLAEAGHFEVVTIVIRWLLKAGRGQLIRATNFGRMQEWADEHLAILDPNPETPVAPSA